MNQSGYKIWEQYVKKGQSKFEDECKFSHDNEPQEKTTKPRTNYKKAQEEKKDFDSHEVEKKEVKRCETAGKTEDRPKLQKRDRYTEGRPKREKRERETEGRPKREKRERDTEGRPKRERETEGRPRREKRDRGTEYRPKREKRQRAFSQEA